MLFKDIIGQENTKKRLIQTVKDNRISHAQLFFGSEGIGKLALAIAYAQYISCENKQENDSCGVCMSCYKYQKLVHPDLHFVFPVIKTSSNQHPVSDNFLSEWRKMILNSSYFSVNQWYEFIGTDKTENTQGSIYVHESEEIIKKLMLKTFESEFKVMIIWLPEKMNISAANKLLKIIEEPPPKTLFLLVSENIDLIIQTIQSRTQLVKIPKIDNISLANAVNEKFNLDKDQLNDIIRLSDGNYINVINNIQSNDEYSYNLDTFIKMMRLAYADKVIDLISWVDSISSIGREKQKGFLEYSIRMIRENYLMNNDIKGIVSLLKDENDFSKKFNKFINQNNIAEITEELNKAYFHIERNGNSKLIFSDLTLKLAKLLKK